MHRFPNGPVTAADGSLRWDVARLHREVLAGLRAAGPVDGLGIDGWAVDYGLLDASGDLLGQPFCYRDGRTDGVRDTVLSRVSEEELFATTGLQQLPFNTIYQLAAETSLEDAATMLLLPDLLGYWLTGEVGAEVTNASTTQLYDVRRHAWATGLAERVDVPVRLLPPLREPGDLVGRLRAAGRGAGRAAGRHAGGRGRVARHRVGRRRRAVRGRPAGGVRLLGHLVAGRRRAGRAGADRGGPPGELHQRGRRRRDDPLPAQRRAGCGCSASRCAPGATDDLAGLLAEAAQAPASGPVVDVDAPEFLPPGDMPARIEAACRATGQDPPATRGAVVRCILESLALAYRRAVRLASSLSGQPVDVVHVVGGGARNDLLCQLTADACGLPVLAGPVEAAALGNVLVQARALGADLPDLVRDARPGPRHPRPGALRARRRLPLGRADPPHRRAVRTSGGHNHPRF